MVLKTTANLQIILLILLITIIRILITEKMIVSIAEVVFKIIITVINGS